MHNWLNSAFCTLSAGTLYFIAPAANGTGSVTLFVNESIFVDPAGSGDLPHLRVPRDHTEACHHQDATSRRTR